MSEGTAKITITLELTKWGTADDMQTALLVLQHLGIVPLNKVQLTFPEMTLEAADILKQNMASTLASVPGGVSVNINTKSDEGVERNLKVGNLPLFRNN